MKATARITAGILVFTLPFAMIATAGTGWFFVVLLCGGTAGGALAAYGDSQ